MGRGTTAREFVRRVEAGGDRSEADQLIVEEPLEIRLDGHVVATTMRTPGHDFELAVGLCVGDGLLGSARVKGVRYCDGPCGPGETTYNTVTVDTGGLAPLPSPRIGTVSSSCGVCGSTAIDELCWRLAPLDPVEAPGREIVERVTSAACSLAALYQATGASHSAAAFDLRGGAVSVVREDIGRHNAVDKVVGRLALDGLLPASGCGLYVSGRASFEMVQKAWAAGFRVLVAVSGPSSLAVKTARTAGLVLVGFARDGRMNIYSPDPLKR